MAVKSGPRASWATELPFSSSYPLPSESTFPLFAPESATAATSRGYNWSKEVALDFRNVLGGIGIQCVPLLGSVVSGIFGVPLFRAVITQYPHELIALVHYPGSLNSKSMLQA